ncbi:DNA polymerase III chi subunit [Blastochloris viridis]|nr:DNA polymerase III chi subunit [Blastochloris viridis]
MLSRTLEQALPPLLAKCLERGWRVAVQATSEERVAALDAHLWTFDEESFLPHGPAGERDAADQPILLTTSAANPNGAAVRFLVDGADLGEAAAYAPYVRAVFLFDGHDEDAVAAARVRWTMLKAAGFEVAYWRQSEAGRWERKG